MSNSEQEFKIRKLVSERDHNLGLILCAEAALQGAKNDPDPGELKDVVRHLAHGFRQRNFKIEDEIDSL